MPLRWGIASAGRISNDFCAALTTLPEGHHEIVAVAARTEESAKEFAEIFKIPKYYGGYEKLATDPDIDIIYVGAVNSTHLELGTMMLDGGKHILCEKPLTLNEKQSKKLLDYAKSKKLFCMEAIWSRFFPAYIHLRNRVDNNELGEIKSIDVEMGLAFTGEDVRTKRELGGGTTLDMGLYPIQLSQFVYQSVPVAIKATGTLNDDGVDVEAEVELKYSNGGVTRFKTSQRKNLTNTAIITGSKGSLTLKSTFWSCTSIIDVNGEAKDWPLPEPKYGKVNFPNSIGLRYEAEEMINYLNKGLLESPVVPHSESLTIVRIQDEIRRQIGVKFDVDD